MPPGFNRAAFFIIGVFFRQAGPAQAWRKPDFLQGKLSE